MRLTLSAFTKPWRKMCLSGRNMLIQAVFFGAGCDYGYGCCWRIHFEASGVVSVLSRGIEDSRTRLSCAGVRLQAGESSEPTSFRDFSPNPLPIRHQTGTIRAQRRTRSGPAS